MFYFLLWSSISTFLIGFWLWSSFVLYRQKVAWRTYAEKRKLRYDGGGFYSSPKITGNIEGYTIAAFTGDHSEFDARLQRRLSSVEVSLNTCVPGRLALATGGMVQIIAGVDLPQEYVPEFTGWDDSYVVRANERSVAQAYLTPERLEALLSLTKIKNAWVVLVFLDGQGLLRLDLPDPVVEPKRLDALFKKLASVAATLELKKGEEISIARKTRQIRDGQSVLKVENEDIFTAGEGLSLELEEEVLPAPEQKPKAKKPKAAPKNTAE